MSKKEITANFAFRNSTKGTHRFDEVNEKGKVVTVDDGAVIGGLYLRKSAIGEDAPKKATLKITVES